jgi:hypothetical protein
MELIHTSQRIIEEDLEVKVHISQVTYKVLKEEENI